MNRALRELLDELETFGKANDANTQDRGRKMLNITADTGVFLTVLIKAARCRQILEIGTSNGYSTLWLADAVGDGGHVTTIDQASDKADLAHHNLVRAGLASRVQQITEEAGQFMAGCGDAEYDFIFLDSDREQYAGWWPTLQRIVRPGCLIVVDNATSHVHQMAEFTRQVAATEGYVRSLVPIGNGELVILKPA
jgi:predicted O-methyltransferase YrrM